MDKIAIVTGSFDPITSGHHDLIKRAAAMFDKIYMVIVANTEKKSGFFTPDERLILAKAAIADIPNADAIVHAGLTSDAAKMLGANFIVRGARTSSDFDYEYTLALIMKRFDPSLETVILPSAPEYVAISSTYVRDLLKYGCELGDAIPDGCREMMVKIARSKFGQ